MQTQENRAERLNGVRLSRILAACRSGESAPVYAALQSWAGRAKTAPLPEWLRGSGDGAVLTEYQRLEARLFAAKPDSGSYDGGKLLAGITEARKKWLARETKSSRPAALPPLNP